MIDAVIFDCDGVLADSEPLHDQATRDELHARGLRVDEAFFELHTGMRLIDQITSLGRQFDLDPTELFEARENRFWSTIDERFTEVPGSAAAVRLLHGTGIRVAVASSGTRRWVDYVTDRMGIRDLLTTCISADDVAKPKPDPEPYQRASAALGIPPTRCAVIEDSPTGHRSAVAAGCHVIVLNRTNRPAAFFPQAALITDSPTQAVAFVIERRRYTGQDH